MSSTKKSTYSRRRFLASGLGTFVSLPLLEWSMGGSAKAFAQAGETHTRFVSFYLPNGIIQSQWWPSEGGGTNFDFSGTALAPLQQYRQSLMVFKNFRNAARLQGGGNAHMRGIAGFLTGQPIPNDRIVRHKISFDQALADHYADVAPTPIHSLQIAGNNKIDPPNNSSYNNTLKNALCFDRNGRILPTTANLRAIFDRMFTGADGNQAQQEAAKRASVRASVLDYVTQERASLRQRLGAGDKLRVEQYFESVRTLEKRLEAFDMMMPSANMCSGMGQTAPKSYDDSRDNHFIGEHARLTAALLALMYQCDMVRVATYMSSGEASKTEYPEVGIPIRFHDVISHDQGRHRDKHHRIDRYHAELVASFIETFEATPHGTGTLMDGTCILMGSGLGNGNSHTMDNIGMMMAGRFGNVRTGRYFADMKGVPHSQLLNAMRDQMKLPASRFEAFGGGPMDLT